MRPLLILTLLIAACATGGGSAHAPVLAIFVGDMTIAAKGADPLGPDRTGAGAVDGTGAEARFLWPFGLAVDDAGNVYLSDRGNNTIRKITSAGVVTTLAGRAGVTGSADGTGAAASFDYPSGIATDRAGNVYVADYGNRTIRKITAAGVVTTIAGTARVQGYVDGTGAAARFEGTLGIAIDSGSSLYVTDLHSTIRKITPAGVVSTFAGKAFAEGSSDGTGAEARFEFPRGIAIDSADNVYVADSASNIIRKITPSGVVTTFAGKAGLDGNADGTGGDARFSDPLGVAVDTADNIYVTEESGEPGRFGHTIRKITPAGVVSTVVGVPGQNGFVPGALPGRIGYPMDIVVSGTSLYVTLAHGVAVVRNRP